MRKFRKFVASVCIAATTVFSVLVAYCVINFVNLPAPLAPAPEEADAMYKNYVYIHNRDIRTEAFGLTIIGVPSLAFAMFFGVISFGVYPTKKEPASA
jgi:hypothetical protein